MRFRSEPESAARAESGRLVAAMTKGARIIGNATGRLQTTSAGAKLITTARPAAPQQVIHQLPLIAWPSVRVPSLRLLGG